MKPALTLPLLKRAAILVVLSSLLHQPPAAHAQGTAFTYQGRLNDGANPANGSYDLRFALYDVLNGGNAVAGPLTNAPTAVSNGLFTVILDFGASAFPGADRWLEINVRTNNGGNFTTLGPRQKLTATPYAITASSVTAPLPASQLSGTLPSGLLSGTYGNVVTFNNPADSFSGNGGGLTNVNAIALGGFAPNQFWKTTGNSNTVSGVNFLGTADNQPLELSVNGRRVLRLEPTTNSPNLIGGFSGNYVTNAATGASIGGGGAAMVFGGNGLNRVMDDFGVVGGGADNRAGNTNADPTDAYYATVGGGVHNVAEGVATFIGGGAENRAANNNSTIAGGYQNMASGYISTIGGGWFNVIQADAGLSVIGGGNFNSISGSYATILGGLDNTAGGLAATVPGGYLNSANGSYSFAAGQEASANHDGAFVWADSQNASFSSTATNQFSVRANGGVRFVTGGAGMTLDGQAVALRTGGNAFTGQQTITGGNVGIGTASPQRTLQVGDSSVAGSEGMIHLGSRSPGGGSLRDWELGVPQTGDLVTGEGYSFVIRDSTASANARLMIKWGTGNVGIGTSTPVSALQVVGTVTATAFNPPSDRNLKENFSPVSPREVLDKIAAMPISRWNFIGDAATPHVGPMAQDFHAAFGLGTDERHIATVDADGVALAAIQGLNQKVEEERAELKQKQTEIAELRHQLEMLKQTVNKLADAKD